MAAAPAEIIPAIDIEKLTEGVPRGSWVALSPTGDRRIAHDESLDGVMSKSEAEGEPLPLIIRVPETATTLIL